MNRHLLMLVGGVATMWLVGALDSQTASRVTEPVDAPKIFGTAPAEILWEKPIRVKPDATGDWELCAMIGDALKHWEKSSGSAIPRTPEDLANGGHLLWKVTALKKLEKEMPPAESSGPAVYGAFLDTVNRDLISAGPGYYWSGVWQEAPGQVYLHWACSYYGSVSQKVSVKRMGGTRMGTVSYSTLTPEQWRNARLLNQLRLGLGYHYIKRNQEARSRADLVRVLGEESSAWKDPEVAQFLEQFLRDYMLKAEKPRSAFLP